MVEQCSKNKWRGAGFSPSQCTNRGKVEHDGKWYCGVHDPEAIKKKQEKRHAEWRVASAARYKRRKHEDACVNAFAALAEHLGREDLNVDLVKWYEASQAMMTIHEEISESPALKPIFDQMRQALPHDTVDRADIGHEE